MEKLYTPEEVAEMLKVEKMSIYRWIKKGIIKSTKINGKVIRIKESEIKKLLQD